MCWPCMQDISIDSGLFKDMLVCEMCGCFLGMGCFAPLMKKDTVFLSVGARKPILLVWKLIRALEDGSLSCKPVITCTTAIHVYNLPQSPDWWTTHHSRSTLARRAHLFDPRQSIFQVFVWLELLQMPEISQSGGSDLICKQSDQASRAENLL